MTTQQLDDVAQAEADVASAERTAADLAEQLLEGTGSAADLVAAEADVETKRGILQRASEFKREREARAAERARLDRIEEMRGLISERFGEHEGGIVDAFENAVAALSPLVELVVEHNAALRAIVGELQQLRPLPADLQPNPDASTLRLAEHDVSIAPIDAVHLVAEAAWRALTANDVAPGSLNGIAHIGHDPQAAERYGLTPRSDGAVAPHGLSDELRRTAHIVAERGA